MPERDRDYDSRHDRDIGRHSREYSSDRRRRRSRSRSRDHYDSPPDRSKREDESSPRSRVKREDNSPPRKREYPPRERSRSPYSKRAPRNREPNSPRRKSSKRSRSPEPWGSHQHDLAYDHEHPPSPPKEKQKPNYGLSGKLAAATNMKNGIVLKYHEPPEAKRTKGWRIYVFKDGKEIDILNLDGLSCFLIGRDRNVFTMLRVGLIAGR